MATTSKYEIVDNEIILRLPSNPRPSNSGKTQLLATSGAGETFKYDGVDVKVNVNVYVPIKQWEAKIARAKKSK